MQRIIMKRSGKLLCSSVAIISFLLLSSLSKTNAVPTDSAGRVRSTLLHRALRDVAALMAPSSLQEYHNDLATPSETALDQPQGQCLHGGVLMARTSVVCEEKSDCLAILKTGHCCRDYKCDCERNGTTYSNGDKLVDPDTPCTVCYCKGGEILCSSAVCFHRDDCTPRYIPGRCCPEYDNCPVANKTMMMSSTQAPKAEAPAATALNPKITIKEITKRTEIRITDDNKAKPIHQMLKTSTTTSTTSTIAPTISPVGGTTDNVLSAATTPKTLTLHKVQETFPRIEEPTRSNNVESLESAVDFVHREDKEQGDDLSKVNIKREFMFGSTEGPLNTSYFEAINNLSSTEILYASPESPDYNASFFQTDSDADSETAGSDNIYHIILSTDGPGDIVSSSTEGFDLLKMPSTTEGPDRTTTEGLKPSEHPTTDAPTDSSTHSPHVARSTEPSMKGTTHHHTEDEDTVELNPAYPVLPEDDFSIRDVNPPIAEVDETADLDIKDEHRSVGVVKTFKEVQIDGSGGGSIVLENESNLLNDTETTTTRVQLLYSSEEASSAETAISNFTDFKMEKIMRDQMENDTGSGDSLEESSLETIIGSELDGGSGGGSEETRNTKHREPTTRKPTRKEVDIDELGSSSGDGTGDLADDPKLDAESLKIDEKDNNNVVQSEPGSPRSDVISVNPNPTQDKSFAP